MLSLPPMSTFPPLNRPPPAASWHVSGSKVKVWAGQSTHPPGRGTGHPSKNLCAEAEALSDDEADLEASMAEIRTYGTGHLVPAGRTTTGDDDLDDNAGDEASPGVQAADSSNTNNPNQANNNNNNNGDDAPSPAETEIAPTHANYQSVPRGSGDSDLGREEEEAQQHRDMGRDLDDDVEDYDQQEHPELIEADDMDSEEEEDDDVEEEEDEEEQEESGGDEDQDDVAMEGGGHSSDSNSM